MTNSLGEARDFSDDYIDSKSSIYVDQTSSDLRFQNTFSSKVVINSSLMEDEGISVEFPRNTSERGRGNCHVVPRDISLGFRYQNAESKRPCDSSEAESCGVLKMGKLLRLQSLTGVVKEQFDTAYQSRNVIQSQSYKRKIGNSWDSYSCQKSPLRKRLKADDHHEDFMADARKGFGQVKLNSRAEVLLVKHRLLEVPEFLSDYIEDILGFVDLKAHGNFAEGELEGDLDALVKGVKRSMMLREGKKKKTLDIEVEKLKAKVQTNRSSILREFQNSQEYKDVLGVNYSEGYTNMLNMCIDHFGAEEMEWAIPSEGDSISKEKGIFSEHRSTGEASVVVQSSPEDEYKLLKVATWSSGRSTSGR
ncbi:hypothetical protein M0R45_006273 [Rubus argutus]|uniref:Uncharacterized protein n=1 Tax=Rubus argutus TaxID=59490 RepID=A0AAW1YPW7_RUBAR